MEEHVEAGATITEAEKKELEDAVLGAVNLLKPHRHKLVGVVGGSLLMITFVLMSGDKAATKDLELIEEIVKEITTGTIIRLRMQNK